MSFNLPKLTAPVCSFSGMSTERQQNASRANGSKSRGPVTQAGKLASSRNAITHGMLSTTIVLKGESTDRFLGAPRHFVRRIPAPNPLRRIARRKHGRNPLASNACLGDGESRHGARDAQAGRNVQRHRIWTRTTTATPPPRARPSPSARSATIPVPSNSSIVTIPVTTASTTVLTGVLWKRVTAAPLRPLQRLSPSPFQPQRYRSRLSLGKVFRKLNPSPLKK
jgi:hypothetical protein